MVRYAKLSLSPLPMIRVPADVLLQMALSRGLKKQLLGAAIERQMTRDFKFEDDKEKKRVCD